MKKLIITDTINFTKDVKNIYDVELWKGRPHGLYEITVPDGEIKRNRFIVSWGIDSNFPDNAPIVFSIPFPNVKVMDVDIEKPEMNHQPEVVQLDGSSITGDTLLKAIAIAQNPELAV